MTFTNKRSLIALLVSLVLVVSLFTVCISATDASSEEITTEETTTVEDTTTAEETTTATETTAAETTTKAEETTTKAEETTAKAEETTSKAQYESESEAARLAEKSRNTTIKSLIINSAIIGVIVIVCVLLLIKFRKKLGDFMRSVKSELKKIVWSSKENTRKSFLVVIVVAIVIAIALWLIDVAFNTGISELAKLIK